MQIFSKKKNVGNDKLIYAMRVTEKITFDKYSKDGRFKYKIPTTGQLESLGDNIYYKNQFGEWVQRKSLHKHKDIKRDLNGRYVLISDCYYYFGDKSLEMPDNFKGIIKKGPGHKGNFDEKLVLRFLNWLENNHHKGLIGNPCKFNKNKSETL